MRSQAPAIMISFLLGFAQIRAEVIPDGIMPRDKRQVVGTGVTSTSTTPTPTTTDDPTTSATPVSTTPITSDTPTTTAPGTTSVDPGTTDQTTTDPGTTVVTSAVSSAAQSTNVPTSIPVTTTNADGSTVTSQVSTNTLVPQSTDNANSIVSTDSSDSNIVQVGSSTINRSTLDHKTVITSALLAESTSRSIHTSYWTSNGQVYSSIVTEEQVYSSTTGYATATVKPSLANGGGNGTNLSDNAKSIIGGVVGGVGGAILVGGLAFFAWRLWGKKKSQQAPAQDEVWGGSRPDSIETAKRSSGMPAYGSQYSNPNGAINTSSNF